MDYETGTRLDRIENNILVLNDKLDKILKEIDQDDQTPKEKK